MPTGRYDTLYLWFPDTEVAHQQEECIDQIPLLMDLGETTMEMIAMKMMVIDMETGMMTGTIERGIATYIGTISAQAEIGIEVVETATDREREEIGMVEMSITEIMTMKSVGATTGEVMQTIMIQGALELT